MTYVVARLSSSTLELLKNALAATDEDHRSHLKQAEDLQGQIDTLQEHLDQITTRAAELRSVAVETATLLTERFRNSERYTLTLEEDGGENSDQPYWELYDWYQEETLETFGTDEAEKTRASAALSVRNASRLDNIHAVETVEYWLDEPA